jgi:peptide/nickel transport system ATP-binding protein
LSESDLDQIVIQGKNLAKLFPVRRSALGSLSGKRKCVHAVSDMDIEIRSGGIFGLVGESGCGKTTTGLMLAGMERPTHGQILFKGIDIWEGKSLQRKGLRKRLQMVFQDPYDSLDPRFDVRSALMEPLLIHNIGETKEMRLDIICKALGSVKLDPDDCLNRRPTELSGGQKQRVCVARALTMRPEFLVADEPVSMLDMSVRAGILDLLLKIRKDYGISILFVGHELPVVRYISDSMSVMYLGTAVESGPTEEIVENPIHPYTQALLSAVPDPWSKERTLRVYAPGEVPSAIDLPRGCRFHSRCQYATDTCRTIEPELSPKKKEHWVRCHHSDKWV